MRCAVPTAGGFPTGVHGQVLNCTCLETLMAYRHYAQHLQTAQLRELHSVTLSTSTVEILCQREAAAHSVALP